MSDEAPRSIELHRTPRGFRLGTFMDRYGISCSIQESSLATEPALWLGTDDNGQGRMHLTRTMARELSELLAHFAEHGVLPGSGAR